MPCPPMTKSGVSMEFPHKTGKSSFGNHPRAFPLRQGHVRLTEVIDLTSA